MEDKIETLKEIIYFKKKEALGEFLKELESTASLEEFLSKIHEEISLSLFKMSFGQPEIVKLLLKHRKVMFPEECAFKKAVFTWCASSIFSEEKLKNENRPECLRILVNSGYEVNSTFNDARKSNLLEKFLQKDDVDCVNTLLSLGARFQK